MSRLVVALVATALVLGGVVGLTGPAVAKVRHAAAVIDAGGDVVRPPSSAKADQAAWLDGIDLTGVTYRVRRGGATPTLTITYRAVGVRQQSRPGAQEYGTLIGRDGYVDVRSAKKAGAVTLTNRHLAPRTVRCAGGMETRDEAAGTVVQVVPLSCLRAAQRVRGTLQSWSRAWRSGGDPRQDVTATTPVLALNAAGHPSSVKAPRRRGPGTIALHADSTGAGTMSDRAPADVRAYADLTGVDFSLHRGGKQPHLTVAYHVGAVAAWLGWGGPMTQRFSVVLRGGHGKHEISEAPVPGSVGLQSLPTCLAGTEVRDAAARTVTQRIPLSCLAEPGVSSTVRLKARVGVAAFPYYGGETTGWTRAVPITSRATR